MSESNFNYNFICNTEETEGLETYAYIKYILKCTHTLKYIHTYHIIRKHTLCKVTNKILKF